MNEQLPSTGRERKSQVWIWVEMTFVRKTILIYKRYSKN